MKTSELTGRYLAAVRHIGDLRKTLREIIRMADADGAFDIKIKAEAALEAIPAAKGSTQ